MAAKEAAAYSGLGFLANKALSALGSSTIPISLALTVASTYLSSGWNGEAYALTSPPTSYHKHEVDLYKSKPRKKSPSEKEALKEYFEKFKGDECAIEFVRNYTQNDNKRKGYRNSHLKFKGDKCAIEFAKPHIQNKTEWANYRNSHITPGCDWSQQNLSKEEIEDDEKKEQLDQPGATAVNNVRFKPRRGN